MNTLSTEVGYRGAATVAAFAAILISTHWVRQLPSRAPLAHFVSRTLLGVAVIAAGVAALNPRWEGLATIAATVLTASAVLTQIDLDRAVELLTGAAVIGLGVAVIGFGVAFLRRGDVLAGVAVIGGGIAVISFGVTLLRRIGILAHAVSWLVSLTKDPGGEALHHDDPALSGSDNPPPGTHTPTPKPPQTT